MKFQLKNKKEECLVVLMEECGEVIQECSKILRFGNDASKLTKELGDLQMMINLTANHLDIDLVQVGVYANEKREKLKKYSDLIVSG
jgi:NTP pyrophosphatase (non-canonical NTP hydrolase)